MSDNHPFPRPKFVHLADISARPALLAKWEKYRHRSAHWLVECVAEFFGVFIYTFAGVGATAGYVLGNIAGEPLSSIFQVGVAYAMGIVLALTICAPTSGGHLNPAVTVAFVVFRKFPPLKAVRYIAAQILGGYVACLLIYVQYQHIISGVEGALAAKGVLDTVNFTPQGPAGIFGLYVTPGSKLGQVFLNEFLCDFFIGISIWACLDPTNFATAPIAAPWVIAFAYGIVIWGYSPVGLAANAARDVGGRLAAMSIWGLKASGGSYAAIAALTNIPATIAGIIFYELFFTDSSRVITSGHVEYIAAHQAHQEHAHNEDMHRRQAGETASASTGQADEKGTTDASERA